ncbi:MAG: hypothetical protein MI863_05935 [Desulfobacterales bacterium]|nr:hypothetical protein [Desulfobacterales bacterium]
MVDFIKRVFSGSGPDKAESNNAPDAKAESGPWVGVDLDGTLAVWDSRSTLDRIGPPVPAMLSYVRRMVDNGVRVKIFTARAGDPGQIPKIEKWLDRNGLTGLEITNVKDYYMERLYDDRAVQVEQNTGRIISKL